MTDSSSADRSNAFPDPRGESTLRTVLLVLQPYLEQLILIGGWVPYLYQRYGGFPEWRTQLSRTTELDLLIPGRLLSLSQLPLAEILSGAGFAAVPNTEGAIWERQSIESETVEFFTEHRGTAREVGRPAPIQGQTEVGAIQLTRLELLTARTRVLEVAPSREGDRLLEVRVPCLGGYVLNKALTFQDRLSVERSGLPKAAKDIVYIRDVMNGGEEVRAQVARDVSELARSKVVLRWTKTARNQLHQLIRRPSQVMEAAETQLSHREGSLSASAARADLNGHLEILVDLLGNRI